MSRESRAGVRQSPLLGSEVNEGCCWNTTVEPTVKDSPQSVSSLIKESSLKTAYLVMLCRLERDHASLDVSLLHQLKLSCSEHMDL